jgi:ABC-type multidrug transport system ATPase subunit
MNNVMNRPIIEVSHLAKRFGTFEAVKDVSFTVHQGDVFGFLGPNGAGKSTTIRCMLSLIQPDAGTVRVFGSTYADNRKGILSKIGSIIEKPDFYKYLSARKNLEIFARISGANVSKKDIDGMLDFVGLSGRGGDKIGGFSHGMKQRLGIAQTLLHQPDLIILDEPTTGLDPQGIVEIRNLILRLKNEQNKTIVLSSHQLSEIELIANRMVIINKGRSIVEGDVKELMNTQDLVVSVEVDDVEKSKGLIAHHFPNAQILSCEGAFLEITLEKQQVPLLNKMLIEASISVGALEPKRKLEDFFMKIVNE